MSKQKAIALLFLVVAIAVYMVIAYNAQWWPWSHYEPYAGWITAKEAYSIAAPYALTGEPDAQLESLHISEEWSRKEELSGKCEAWELTFCASDGAYITLEVRDRTLYLGFPWHGLANEKESSEFWEEARAEGNIHSTQKVYSVGSWVDSTKVFEDALSRAQNDLDGDDIEEANVKLVARDLPVERYEDYPQDVQSVWVIRFESYAIGYEYVYDAADGSYIKKVLWY